MSIHINPFLYGNPVHPEHFIGRRAILRRVIGRLSNQGQSTALVGEPRLGKTSLLRYLQASEKRTELYGSAADRVHFCYIDCHTLPGDCTMTQFWEIALRTLKMEWGDTAPDDPLVQRYQQSAAAGHTAFTLELLFQQFQQEGRQLILLLDEFDHLVHHPSLSNAAFFGSLRSLASLNRALTLVIASRLSLARLNADTQSYNRTGSPFFNIFAEVSLGGLTETACEQLLALAGDRFTPADRVYICALAGTHPYLLQATAATMWEAHDEGISDPATRHRYVWHELRGTIHHHFADTWQAWTPSFRHAFVSIALLTTKEQALPQLPLPLQSFQERLPELMPELNALKATGVLREASDLVGWQVSQGVLLTWLWDELIREIRDERSLGQWLGRTALETHWTQAQRQEVQALIQQVLHTHPQVAITIAHTEGGPYIAGAVNAGGDFVGRDQDGQVPHRK